MAKQKKKFDQREKLLDIESKLYKLLDLFNGLASQCKTNGQIAVANYREIEKHKEIMGDLKNIANSFKDFDTAPLPKAEDYPNYQEKKDE